MLTFSTAPNENDLCAIVGIDTRYIKKCAAHVSTPFIWRLSSALIIRESLTAAKARLRKRIGAQCSLPSASSPPAWSAHRASARSVSTYKQHSMVR